jgi:hypothetical protein
MLYVELSASGIANPAGSSHLFPVSVLCGSPEIMRTLLSLFGLMFTKQAFRDHGDSFYKNIFGAAPFYGSL